jgi:NarL family two-component system response regulator LiaR
VEAGQLAAALHPDVILLDMAMPRKTGLEAIYDIKRDDPQARILVLTSFAEDDQIFPAIKAGATGYLLKDASPRELLQAIRDVERGDVSLHPTIARKLVGELKRPPDLPPAEEQLTEREWCWRWCARPVQSRDRRSLGHYERTVRTHVATSCAKLYLAIARRPRCTRSARD